MIKFDKVCDQNNIYYNYLLAISGLLPHLSDRDLKVLSEYMILHKSIGKSELDLSESKYRRTVYKKAGVDKTNIAKVVNRLVKKGFMIRTKFNQLIINPKIIPNIVNGKITININLHLNDN